jgi:anaerobic selenocysteine-containing dehydrogenase
MGELGRRDFLKLIGLTSTVTAVGCSSESARKLIPYVSAPEDVIPGEAVWYASTCRECPAGCGLLAKNRDGHVIKVEGNPLHPVSGGKLCPRGQASLHGLYNPDRFAGPLRRNAGGKFTPISWAEGEEFLTRSLSDAIQRGRGDRIVFLTDLATGSLQDLIGLWLGELGSAEGHVMYGGIPALWTFVGHDREGRDYPKGPGGICDHACLWPWHDAGPFFARPFRIDAIR